MNIFKLWTGSNEWLNSHGGHTYKNMVFLTIHNPTNKTLNKVFEKVKKYAITTIVRVHEATYDTALMGKEDIHVLEWPLMKGAI